jgi:abortive infection bacteriophage resistance protein
MKYDKAAYTIPEQIAQLKERGLHISNDLLATKYLSHVSYYRLAGYWWSMQADKETHQFKPRSKQFRCNQTLQF